MLPTVLILSLMGMALCWMVLNYYTTSHTIISKGTFGSKQYDIYVSNLQRCLDASNLTHHFHQENYSGTAVTNVKNYTDSLHKFIPKQFNTALPNHCWNADVKLDLSSSLISGHVNGTKFSVNRRDMNQSFNTLPGFIAGTTHHYLSLSCIPEVFVLGFNKCGSTFLHCLITSHPAVSRAFRREPNFFKSLNILNNENITAFLFADYIVNFEKAIRNAINESAAGSVSVDGSVGTMRGWPVFSGQQKVINYCLLPSVIPEILPKAKFIVVMREPLSMLYSFFWYTCTRKHFNHPVPSREAQLKGPDIFHERIVARILYFKSCLTVFPLAKCIVESRDIPDPFDPLMPICGETSIFRAFYYMHILKWLSVVPRERFLFLTLEELSSNMDQTVNMVWRFIGIDSFAIKSKYCMGSNQQTAIDYKNDPRLAMRNDTREILRSFFRPYNQMLADLLGDRKFFGTRHAYA